MTEREDQEGPPRRAERPLGIGQPAAELRASRMTARGEAARALTDLGFIAQATPGDHWTGALVLPRSAATLKVEVSLPHAFPDTLPRIKVIGGQLAKPIAHVDWFGTVCVVPSSNVLLDADRPGDLVRVAVQRATEILDRGTLGESDADLDAEFEAYWFPTSTTSFLSLCDADGPSRQIAMCKFSDGPALAKNSWMLADNAEAVEAWSENIRSKIDTVQHALFIQASTSLPLLNAGEALTVKELSRFINAHASEAGRKLFRETIESADYPQVLVFSMPEAPEGSGRRLAAALLRRPDPTLLQRAARGFRRGPIPAARVLRKIGRNMVQRLALTRVDTAFLTARGGAARHLSKTTVVIVGIGAVGSEVARNLASIGVGNIRLVDDDDMKPENVHRHVLGMNSAGYPKVVGLCLDLRSQFPHLSFSYKSVRVEELLSSDPGFLLESDLVVLATGEETLERRLNRLLYAGPTRVHTWLEPLGIGGHAFACGSGHQTGRGLVTPGCFECLYRPDDTYGLVNRSAFTAPGQEIRRSLAGCAATFSPFSGLDARRTAADATDLVGRVLLKSAVLPVLASWRGLHTDFEAAGFRLSARASQIVPGARMEIAGADIVRDSCQVCGSRARLMSLATGE